jgi:hypothetical protein
MARLLTTHSKTPPLDARLRGHDGDGRVGCHSRESGNPAIGRKRSFGTAWHISMAVLACLMASASLAHAHGGMAGPEELGPPIFTSGLLGFVCYWLVILWPSSKKKGDTEVRPGTQNKSATRTHRRSHKNAVHVKRVPRLRKVQHSGQVGSNVNSGRRATDV